MQSGFDQWTTQWWKIQLLQSIFQTLKSKDRWSSWIRLVHETHIIVIESQNSATGTKKKERRHTKSWFDNDERTWNRRFERKLNGRWLSHDQLLTDYERNITNTSRSKKWWNERGTISDEIEETLSTRSQINKEKKIKNKRQQKRSSRKLRFLEGKKGKRVNVWKLIQEL